MEESFIKKETATIAGTIFIATGILVAVLSDIFNCNYNIITGMLCIVAGICLVYNKEKEN